MKRACFSNEKGVESTDLVYKCMKYQYLKNILKKCNKAFVFCDFPPLCTAGKHQGRLTCQRLSARRFSCQPSNTSRDLFCVSLHECFM